MVAQRKLKRIKYSTEKNEVLKQTRGVGFEDVLLCINNDRVMDVFPHPNQEKYQGQTIFIVDINGYICFVPFVETEEEIFLKTIIPSRKMNKKYKGVV